MSNYGKIDTKNQKFICNTSIDTIHYFSAVASEDPSKVYIAYIGLVFFKKYKQFMSNCLGTVLWRQSLL